RGATALMFEKHLSLKDINLVKLIEFLSRMNGSVPGIQKFYKVEYTAAAQDVTLYLRKVINTGLGEKGKAPVRIIPWKTLEKAPAPAPAPAPGAPGTCPGTYFTALPVWLVQLIELFTFYMLSSTMLKRGLAWWDKHYGGTSFDRNREDDDDEEY
ncbi:hypothetical protein HDU99_005980, partial [Rhizoclosmatium hyalinum]